MTLILMILACVCLLMQALQFNVKRVEIGWLGMFFWALAITIPGSGVLGQSALALIAVLLIVLIIVAVRRNP